MILLCLRLASLRYRTDNLSPRVHPQFSGKLSQPGNVLMGVAVIEVVTIGDSVGIESCRAAELECELKRLLTSAVPSRREGRIRFDQRGDQPGDKRDYLVLPRT